MDIEQNRTVTAFFSPFDDVQTTLASTSFALCTSPDLVLELVETSQWRE
jgi:hypothetical protein